MSKPHLSAAAVPCYLPTPHHLLMVQLVLVVLVAVLYEIDFALVACRSSPAMYFMHDVLLLL